MPVIRIIYWMQQFLLYDLTINGSGGDDANVELLVSPLEVGGDLTLQSATSFLDANVDFDIDVT